MRAESRERQDDFGRNRGEEVLERDEQRDPQVAELVDDVRDPLGKVRQHWEQIRDVGGTHQPSRLLASVSTRRHQGTNEPVGTTITATERSTSKVTALLADLVERGLDPEQGILFVLDGAKALKITGTLKRTLSSTNPIESMIEIVRKTQRNVKRWQSGDRAVATLITV